MAGKPVGWWWCSALLLALVALAACAPPDSGDPNLAGCLVDTETAIDDPQAIPSGFTLSPAEARARALGLAAGGLDRHDGVRIDLTLTIDAAGPMTLQRRSWQTPPGGWRAESASDFDCEDAYALPVTVAVQALPDLDLVEATTITVTARGRAAFHLRVDAAAHRGSAAPADGDVDDAVTTIDLLLDAGRDDGAWTGEVGFGIERRHGLGPDGSVSYAFSPWGAWEAVAVAPTSP
jgi:hypothetical protein